MRCSRERETTEESPCVNADAGCNYSSTSRFPGLMEFAMNARGSGESPE